jgi:formyltetrahydrofolate deformylase
MRGVLSVAEPRLQTVQDEPLQDKTPRVRQDASLRPDTTGVVEAVTGCLAQNRATITEALHFDDVARDTAFLRVVFRDNGQGMPNVAELGRLFAKAVADPFNMTWKLNSSQKKQCRTILAVSKHGHCINSLLHRWSTNTLPIDVLAVISNHEDMRRLAEWHGVPFIYLPVANGDKAAQEAKVNDLFERFDAEVLVLARYMQIPSDDASQHFAGRCINIHHSFLPGFKGARAYHQAFDHAVKFIGVTSHHVTSDLDEGPIIDQEVGRIDHTASADDLADIGKTLKASRSTVPSNGMPSVASLSTAPRPWCCDKVEEQAVINIAAQFVVGNTLANSAKIRYPTGLAECKASML